MGIQYRKLTRPEISMFSQIDRTETIHRIYYYRDGNLVLEEEHYEMPDWSPQIKQNRIADLQELFDQGALIFGAFDFDNDALIGMSVLDIRPLKSGYGRLNLEGLWVSHNYRGKGIGKALFQLALQEARERGAKSIYVSATPSESTVRFYLGLGCKLACPIDPNLFEKEPEDIHLEMFITQSPYNQCPVIDGENLQLRLVSFADADDLLKCYSDPKAQPIFNSDNCTSNFAYSTADEMRNAIRFWLADYERKIYVRFSIVDEKSGHVIGTIEFFTKKATDEKTEIGLLRIDLQSKFETAEVLDELIQMAEAYFPKYFTYEAIVTNAIRAAEKRTQALQKNGFEHLLNKSLVNYDDYYVKRY